jgi:C-terminal processing protease CtpA/Prc
MNRAAPLLATAASGSTVKLTVKRADGHTTDVDVQLMAGNTQSVPASRTGNAIRLLNERTGYADLERVEASQVDAIFDQFKDTAAIIFDLRGYPRSHALAIAARIAPQSLGVAAELFHNVVGVGSGDGNIRFQETELRIPKSTKPQYKGKVVALVDEMTSTLGGDSAMCLKSAGAVLIGSHTFARFTQTSSTFDVPGGIRIVFSGSIPRWPGGKLLSPEGVVPDVEVRPTIASIRENKDDVLQAAMKYLESK